MRGKIAKKIISETSKETKEKAREYGNNLIKRKCIYCKQPTSGENISYCDKCLMNNDYSN